MKQPEYIEGPEALKNFERRHDSTFQGSQARYRAGKKEGQEAQCPAQKEATRQGLEGHLCLLPRPVASWRGDSFLHSEEAQYFAQVVRRISAILLLGPTLDASYRAILPTATGLPTP